MMARRATVLLAAALLSACSTLSPAARSDDAIADPVLVAKAQDIASIREIKRLTHLWGHYADAGQWDEMSLLFAAEGEWADGNETVTGRQAIAGFLREGMGGGSQGLSPDRLNIHLMLSPVITLSADGERATGRWHEVAMTGRNGQSADWAGGIHVIDYVRQDGEWAIARMFYHPQYAGPYSTGWKHVQPQVAKVEYHYTPDQAGTPIPLSRKAARAQTSAALAADAELLLAEGLVQNLQAAYGFYLDRQMYDDIVDLFTPDATFEVAGVGRWQGSEGVRKALLRFGSAGLQDGELNDRPQLMPVVTMAADGKSATLRNVELGMTGQHAGPTFWSLAVQEFDMVRGEDRTWRIAALRRFPRMRAEYEDGWQSPLEAALPTPASAQPAYATSLSSAAYPGAASVPVKISDEFPQAPAFVSEADAGQLLAQAAAFDGAENISNAYGYYIDEFEWDGTADLFSTDGWKELSYIGTYIGRERVRGSLVNRYGRGGRRGAFMAIHQKTQPYVTVSQDGQRANIRLRLLQFNSQADAAGSWISGIYENQAVLEDGIWRIHGMDLDYVWLGDYVGGWAGIEPGSSERFKPDPADVAKYPPDAPLRGVTFAPFPSVAPMGFHFANPVSGREPATRLRWSDGRRAERAE